MVSKITAPPVGECVAVHYYLESKIIPGGHWGLVSSKDSVFTDRQEAINMMEQYRAQRDDVGGECRVLYRVLMASLYHAPIREEIEPD